MGTTLQDLVSKYSFEIDDAPLKKVQEKIGGLVGFASKLGLAAGAAAGAIFGMAKVTAQAGDEALATSQKLGISVENLTRLQFAAKLSNVEAGNLNVGLRFLSRNVDNASQGTGEAAKAFKTLGISLKDSTGQLLPSNEVLLKVSEKLSKMPDGVKKTALAMDIFGRSGSDLIPLLNEGADGIQRMMDRSDELGATMSTDLAKAGDNFNDSLDEMMFALKGVQKMVGGGLLPILTPLIQQFTKFIVENKKIISLNLGKFFSALSTFARGVWIVFQGLYRITSGLANIFGGFENVLKGLVGIFLVFSGAKILFGIGAIALAMGGLAAKITMVNVAALLIPTLIGAAIALVALLIEDVFTFFNDPEADTLTGSLVQGIKDLWKAFEEFFASMSGWGQAIINYLLTPFRAVINTFKTIIDLVKLAKGDISLGDVGKNLVNNFKNVATGGSTIGGALGFSPDVNPSSTPSASKVMNNQPAITNNITVGDNADPLQIQKSVTFGTKDGMDQSLRGAQRSFNGKGAY